MSVRLLLIKNEELNNFLRVEKPDPELFVAPLARNYWSSSVHYSAEVAVNEGTYSFAVLKRNVTSIHNSTNQNGFFFCQYPFLDQ